MSSVLAAVSDFPVIVQGALGSALFALLLYLGQKLAEYAKGRATTFSATQRRRYLIEEEIRYRVIATKENAERGVYITLLLYRASRSLFKALIWLSLGLITSAVLNVLSVVGYAGALYYLFAGLATLAPPEEASDPTARIAEINSELEELRQRNSAPIKEGP